MRFSRIYLEITNVCNLACSFCPKTKRPPRTLTADEFSLLAAKLRPFSDDLYLHVMGEPLLHPQLAELLQIADSLGFRVSLTTNGTLLGQAGGTLLSAPALHRVSVSLHSFEANGQTDPESYIRTCAGFGRLAAERGILVSYRLWNVGGQDAQNSAITQTLAQTFPLPWTENTRGFRLKDGVFLEYAEKFDWPDAEKPELRTHGRCHALQQQLAVLCDGTVVPCCLDHEGDLPLGNLFAQELSEILDTARTRAVRSGLCGKSPLAPLCRRCGYAARFLKK